MTTAMTQQGYASQIKLVHFVKHFKDLWNEELISTKDDQLEELRYDLHTSETASGLPAVGADIRLASKNSLTDLSVSFCLILDF